MSFQFTKAVKHESKLRLALIGPSGSGKTYTALRIATGLGGRIAVIDTESGSASKYADEFEFDTLQLTNYHPDNYIGAMKAAAEAGYDVLIIDSLSHAWSGTGGALELADKETAKTRSGNSYTAWAKVTPVWNRLLSAIVDSGCHVIGTMRSKTEYVLETNDKGKTVPRKVGMAPIFRDGGEYEFDVVGEMTLEHRMIVTKTRCRPLDEAVLDKPGEDVAATLIEWLHGAPRPEQRPETQPEKPARPYKPEDLRKMLLRVGEDAQEKGCKRTREESAQKAALALGNLGFNKDERHAFNQWAFGDASQNDLLQGYNEAIIRWANVNPEKDGNAVNWVPDATALEEARAAKFRVRTGAAVSGEALPISDDAEEEDFLGDGLGKLGEPVGEGA